MHRFRTGNVVKWRKQHYIVAGDDGRVVQLIQMNCSNSMAYPTDEWPTPETGRESIQLVSETVYGWMVNSIMVNVFNVTENLSADGWAPR